MTDHEIYKRLAIRYRTGDELSRDELETLHALAVRSQNYLLIRQVRADIDAS